MMAGFVGSEFLEPEPGVEQIFDLKSTDDVAAGNTPTDAGIDDRERLMIFRKFEKSKLENGRFVHEVFARVQTAPTGHNSATRPVLS